MAPRRAADRAARGILAVAAAGALVSAVTAIPAATGAGDATAVMAWHDLLGFPVFAGMFALLAWRPRGFPGIWELLIAQKAAMAAIALALAGSGADDAPLVAAVDGALATALLLAYRLAGAHRAWRRL